MWTRCSPCTRRSNDQDQYLRFSTIHPAELDDYVRRTLDPDGGAVSLGARVRGRLVGLVQLLPTGGDAGEVAAVVERASRGEGVATVLLEHLADVALRVGIRRLVAEVLAENGRMMRVLTDLGLPLAVTRQGSSMRIEVALDDRHRYATAAEARHRAAAAAGLRAVLRPRSVALIGVSRKEHSVGRAVLRSLRAGRLRRVGHRRPPDGRRHRRHRVRPRRRGAPGGGSTWPSWPCRSRPSSGLSTTAVGSACACRPAHHLGHRPGARSGRSTPRRCATGTACASSDPTPSGWSGPARDHRLDTTFTAETAPPRRHRPRGPVRWDRHRGRQRLGAPRSGSLRARGHRRRGGRRRARRARLVRRGPGNRPRRPLCRIGTGPAGPGADRRAPRRPHPRAGHPGRHLPGRGAGRGLAHRPVRHPGGPARGRLRRCGHPVGPRPDRPDGRRRSAARAAAPGPGHRRRPHQPRRGRGARCRRLRRGGPPGRSAAAGRAGAAARRCCRPWRVSATRSTPAPRSAWTSSPRR